MYRRQFLQSSVSCCAHVLGLATFAPSLTRKVFAAQEKSEVVAEEKWGRLEKVQDGVYALISTPFDSRDFTTVCNGGLIVGDKGVLAVEAFMQTKGAKWLAEQSKKLTGKLPTDVVCTHYHGDHTSGFAGYVMGKQRPNLWLTESTEKSAIEAAEKNPNSNIDFGQVNRLKSDANNEIDLGNRKVNIVPRQGHTQSDVTIELTDPQMIWTGDLFFNRMFPNYSDAMPARLNDYVDELMKQTDAMIIPGHGPIAGQNELKVYKKFLGFVQENAEKAFKAGKSAEEGAKDFKLTDDLKEWLIWSPDVVKRSYVAWYKQWESKAKAGSESKSK